MSVEKMKMLKFKCLNCDAEHTLKFEEGKPVLEILNPEPEEIKTDEPGKPESENNEDDFFTSLKKWWNE